MLDHTDSQLSSTPDLTTNCWEEKEKRRLKNIKDYNLTNHDIEDRGLLSLTKLAAYICDTSLSTITLVGAEHIDFLSRVGCPLTGTNRENSFCTHAIEQDGFYEIEDTLEDERFRENLFVIGQETPVRYYAGWPLKSTEGNNFGSLCVADFKPKKVNEQQKEALKTLGEQVMNQLCAHIIQRHLTLR
jgi:GAF domain-containing protein